MTAPNRMFVHRPLAPDDETLTRGDRMIAATSPTGDALVAYCPTNRCGAVYYLGAEVWAMYCPIPLAEFLRTLERRRIVVDPAARERWLLAVTPPPATPN